MSTKARLTSVVEVRNYIRGGHATFTLVSGRTGKRFTYRLDTPTDSANTNRFWFTRLLTGSDNEEHYSWIGSTFIRPHSSVDFGFKHSDKSPISRDALSIKAYEYFIRLLNYLGEDEIPEPLEFWTSGKCSRCNRTLTTPESVARGLGPECAKIVGVL